MHNLVKIKDTETAARFCAALTKQNVVFTAEHVDGVFLITITGY